MAGNNEDLYFLCSCLCFLHFLLLGHIVFVPWLGDYDLDDLFFNARLLEPPRAAEAVKLPEYGTVPGA